MLKRTLILGTCLIAIGGLTACSQDHEGNVSMKRLEVREAEHAVQVFSHDLKQSDLESIAADYQRYGGNGPLSVMVQYDPLSPKNTPMNATKHASAIANGLREAGVQSVKTEIMPVRDVGHHSKTLVTYDRYTASAPDDCGVMPGMNNTATDWKAVQEYDFGCSVESNIAKQIARPRDLMGNDKFDTDFDARRVSNVIEGYRTGTPNEALEGETASDE